MIITNPDFMSAVDWADRVALDITGYGAVGRLDSEIGWREWAVQLLNLPALPTGTPNPYNYTYWRDWARDFVKVLA